MKKVVFILNSVQQQRCLKRIEEFIQNGYEVEAYGFQRSEKIPTQPKNFTVHIIGRFDNTMPYAKRLPLMRQAMRKVFQAHQGESVLYYYFLLDVAMVGYSLNHAPFVYENSDLMHLDFGHAVLRKLFCRIDKFIIRRSLLTVMTSQGFVNYYYGDKKPDNVLVVPNRLNEQITSLPYHPTPYHIDHLRFGFVGFARSEQVFRFAETLVRHFPQHEMHFFGLYYQALNDYEGLAAAFPNFHLHGPFSNPQDLPAIYEQIDLLVSTYDVKTKQNPRYAEANKLYEAIWFEKPFVCSLGCFMGNKAVRLGFGYELDTTNEQAIIDFVQHLTQASLDDKLQHLRALDKQSCINRNPELFAYLHAKNF